MQAPAPPHPNPAPAPGLDPGVDPGVASQLAADAYYHLVHTLCLALPPPPSDNPEDLAQRNHAAIARAAALVPANAAEASLAAEFVAASEQGRDCLRLAQLPETTPDTALKCRAQALRMMREAKARCGCCSNCRRRAASGMRTTPAPTAPPGPNIVPSP